MKRSLAKRRTMPAAAGAAALGLALVLSAAPVAAQAGGHPGPAAKVVNCNVCHGEQATKHQAGVHAEAGVGCVACHGGDPTMDASKGTKAACVEHPSFKGIPRGKASVQLCGSCHSDVDAMRRFSLQTDQLALYEQSPHGKRLFESEDPDVPTCVTCHGSHDVRHVTDPASPAYRANVPKSCATCHADAEKMKRHELPADVFDEYAKSAHGRGLLEGQQLRLPHCGDCHSSHGAKPAGVKEVADMCGHCHVAARESFRRSPHAAAVEAGKMAECTSCHGHHAIESVGNPVTTPWSTESCTKCHNPTATDAPYTQAQRMAGLMDGLRRRVAETEARIHEARDSGMIVTAEENFLSEARHVLVMSGPRGHLVSVDDFTALAQKGEGIVRQVEENLEVKLRRLRDRRWISVAVFAAVLALVAAVAMKLAAVAKGAGGGRT